MALTKKFFKALADEYRDLRPDPEVDAAGYEVWCAMVERTATMMRSQDGTFQFGMFYAACAGVDMVPLQRPGL